MGRDSALSGRLTVAAIVAIFFVVQYLATREFDQVTGEKHQFAYSVEKEIEMGQAAAPKFIRENGGELSGRASDMVRRLGNTVVRNSVASKSAYPFQFHLLNDDVTINAFVSPPSHSG
jgi:predicted Zn-dependent protease